MECGEGWVTKLSERPGALREPTFVLSWVVTRDRVRLMAFGRNPLLWMRTRNAPASCVFRVPCVFLGLWKRTSRSQCSCAEHVSASACMRIHALRKTVAMSYAQSKHLQLWRRRRRRPAAAPAPPLLAAHRPPCRTTSPAATKGHIERRALADSCTRC